MSCLPGYDAWKTSPPHYYDEDPDEGIEILESAMAHLKPRADADADDQVSGEFEAYEILQGCILLIHHDYECHFCGEPMREKGKYCSRNCYRADAEGL